MASTPDNRTSECGFSDGNNGASQVVVIVVEGENQSTDQTGCRQQPMTMHSCAATATQQGTEVPLFAPELYGQQITCQQAGMMNDPAQQQQAMQQQMNAWPTVWPYGAQAGQLVQVTPPVWQFGAQEEARANEPRVPPQAQVTMDHPLLQALSDATHVSTEMVQLLQQHIGMMMQQQQQQIQLLQQQFGMVTPQQQQHMQLLQQQFGMMTQQQTQPPCSPCVSNQVKKPRTNFFKVTDCSYMFTQEHERAAATSATATAAAPAATTTAAMAQKIPSDRSWRPRNKETTTNTGMGRPVPTNKFTQPSESGQLTPVSLEDFALVMSNKRVFNHLTGEQLMIMLSGGTDKSGVKWVNTTLPHLAPKIAGQATEQDMLHSEFMNSYVLLMNQAAQSIMSEQFDTEEQAYHAFTHMLRSYIPG